ncbi:hypothetical protein ACTFIZ_000383 [Dictyostelium cf. discoideum]
MPLCFYVKGSGMVIIYTFISIQRILWKLRFALSMLTSWSLFIYERIIGVIMFKHNYVIYRNRTLEPLKNYSLHSELLLKRLYDKIQANLIGSLMDLIWYRRNKLKFDKEEPLITLDLVLYKLCNARDAEWERNLKKLEKYSNVWNSNLMKMHIPEHLEKYCSFNTNFLI